ncbi:hypothetical protein SCLCIDRAFT_754349 [Scleroderma citrinum Foug A]|uniref:Uncharacterized protein n=1 Tax=Scleroderma citrinum Foug A TaxID=1036808 RepID=A0A0C3AEH7_9AGAM|nr:hypothetical protein SCLCIDRAFT_754349 [Scleroderma citrinum Foug A]
MPVTHPNDTDRYSGFDAVGLGFLTGSLDDDDEDVKPPQKQPMPAPAAPRQPASIPLAAPRPGYPAPVAALKMPPSPESTQRAQPPQMSQVPQALRVTRPQVDVGAPRMPAPIYQTPAVPRPVVPSTPHPLQPPMMPITPVFARPSKSPAPASDVKFASEVIIRGNSEDNLLPKRGDHGDHFWRRFSMVAKEEKKPSSWLIKTQNGMSWMSRWVWLVAIVILAGIGLGIAYGVIHRSTNYTPPTAVGGKANETAGPTTISNIPTSTPGQISASLHVSPTNTVARRGPEPTHLDAIYVPHMRSDDLLHRLVQPKPPKHSRKHRLRHPGH